LVFNIYLIKVKNNKEILLNNIDYPVELCYYVDTQKPFTLIILSHKYKKDAVINLAAFFVVIFVIKLQKKLC